jgi:hypothetical protein
MLLLRGCFGRGICFEPIRGIEATVPSLYIWRSLFRTSDQAKKLSNMEHDA